MLAFEKTIECCPNCNSDRFTNFETHKHFNYYLNYVICEDCTLIFMQPQMTDEETDRFYQTEYRKLYQSSDTPTPKLIATQTERGEYLASFFLTNSGFDRNKAFNYLDIGCSTGVHLDAIKRTFPNAKIYGIEPGNEFRTYCKKKGLKVFSTLEEFEIEKIQIDAVCLSHVLEHISNPVLFLKKINAIQKKDGLLLIEVPNTTGGHVSYELAHPTCFYSNTLIDTCAKASYDKIKILEHNNTSKYNIPMYLLGLFQKKDEITTVRNFLTTEQIKRMRKSASQKLERQKKYKKVIKKIIGLFK